MSLLRQPGKPPRAQEESSIGTSPGVPRLAARVERGGSGSRTSGLEPQCGHCVRSIPVTSCIHWTTLCGRRGVARRAGPAGSDNGAGYEPCAGWRGSHNAGAACSRGVTQARGSGGYIRRRRVSWSGHHCPDDGYGRQSGPARPARRGADGWRWRRDGYSGRHSLRRKQDRPGAPWHRRPTLW